MFLRVSTVLKGKSVTAKLQFIQLAFCDLNDMQSYILSCCVQQVYHSLVATLNCGSVVKKGRQFYAWAFIAIQSQWDLGEVENLFL